nr:MAG TPA: hypothetical protein [Caudoviricetes sp.]
MLSVSLYFVYAHCALMGATRPAHREKCTVYTLILQSGKTTLILYSRIAPIARILSLMQRALAPRR